MITPEQTYENSPLFSPCRETGRNHLTVIGLGNEYLSDDGAGIYSVRQLKEYAYRVRQEGKDSIDEIVFEELALGGLQLLDYIVGFDRCIIIDAVISGVHPPGTIYRCELVPGTEPAGVSTSHQIDLLQVIRLAKSLKAQVPQHVTVYGVEALEVMRFGTKCTEPVEKAIPRLVELIYKSLVNHWSCSEDRIVSSESSAGNPFGNWEIIRN